MNELIALPVLPDRVKLGAEPEVERSDYGGAFRDEYGHVWGTFRLASGWVRYPAHLSLLG